MYDKFEIIDEYDFIVADKICNLNLDTSFSKKSIENNIKILNDNNWSNIGNFLFYLTVENQVLKKINIWIDIRTGNIAEKNIIKEEVTKYYLNSGYKLYKSTNLLYKWESNRNNKTDRKWIDSSTGLPPNVPPLDLEEIKYDNYILDKEKERLLPERELRKRYRKKNYINDYSNKDICSLICNYIKSIFI